MGNKASILMTGASFSGSLTNLRNGRHGKLGSQGRRGIHHLLCLVLERLILLICRPAVSRYKSIHRSDREMKVGGDSVGKRAL